MCVRAAAQIACMYSHELRRTGVNRNPNCNPAGAERHRTSHATILICDLADDWMACFRPYSCNAARLPDDGPGTGNGTLLATATVPDPTILSDTAVGSKSYSPIASSLWVTVTAALGRCSSADAAMVAFAMCPRSVWRKPGSETWASSLG